MADDASLSSQRSGLSGSLLERIRAQRERESSVASPSVQIPSYSPDMGSNDSNAWSMNVSWPRFGSSNPEAAVSLLEVEGAGEQSYSMTRYFQTFVQDVYNGFRSIHPVLQVGLVLVLLFVAIKLIFFF